MWGRGMGRRFAETIRALAGIRPKPAPAVPQPAAGAMPMPEPGKVVTGRMALPDGGTERGYRLFRPVGVGDGGAPAPLVVWLHGCTQNAEDFATGTRIDRFASEQGFIVLQPEQDSGANPRSCWNWFNRRDQQTDRGEAALIAAMTQAAIASGLVDSRRVYVAGLSAGGAMAALMGQLWPDLYAAVGVHSGLPAWAARNVPAALWVMRRGAIPAKGIAHPPPLIIVHGDADKVVVPANAAALLRQYETEAGSGEEREIAGPGRLPTRISTRRNKAGQVRVELWMVAGGGHGWMGGDSRGSHTEPQGPDATGEILRFFLEQKVNL